MLNYQRVTTRDGKNQAEWGCHGTLQGDLEVQLELLLWITMVILLIFVGTRAPYNYGYIMLYNYNWNCPPQSMGVSVNDF